MASFRGSTPFLIILYATLALITNFPSGFTNSTVNTAVEEIHNYINQSYVRRGVEITEATISLVQSTVLNCWFVTQIFGAMLTPFFCDRFGRRKSYITAVCLTIIGSTVQYAAYKTYLPELLVVGRSIVALSSPLADASLLLYVQETSPVGIRGMASFFCEIGYGAMCILGMILGMKSILGQHLDKLMLVGLVPEILSLFVVCMIPDTPKYLMIMKNNRKHARKSLAFFQGKTDDRERILDDYEKEKEGDADTSSVKEIFTTWHLKQSVVLSCCVLVLTLPFYPMLQSSTYFFLKTNIKKELAELSSTLLMVVITLSSIVGASIIDRYPRRMLLVTFGTITNVFLTMFSICSFFVESFFWVKYAALASIFGFSIAFGMVLGPMSWFVAPELVSQRHKATVFSICFAFQNVFIAITDFAVLPLFRMMGGICFIPLFVLPAIFCVIYIHFYLPETLGKETHEVVLRMVQKRNKYNFTGRKRIDSTKYKIFVTPAAESFDEMRGVTEMVDTSNYDTVASTANMMVLARESGRNATA